MALNFPNNPEAVNNTYTAPNGVIYHYDGVKWIGQSIEGIVTIPTASVGVSGVVKVDGTTISVIDGVISTVNIDGGNSTTSY